MSESGELLSNYSRIRAKLRHPPNAVFDRGIDLRRNRLPPELDPPPPKKVLEPPVETGFVKVIHRPLILPNKPTLGMIERLVCVHFKVTAYDLHCYSRRGAVVYPRHIFFYLAYKHTGLSMPQIGHRGQQYRCGQKRDHTTVLHALRRISEMMLVRDDTVETVRFLEEQIHVRCDRSEPSVASVSELHLEVDRGESVSESEIHGVA